MIPTIDISSDIARIQKKYDLLPAELAKAIPRAINRSMPAVRKAGTDALRNDYPGIKVGQLRARMLGKAAKLGVPEASIRFLAGRFKLYGNFGMTPFGKFGVQFKKLPWRIDTISGDTIDPGELQAAMRRVFRNRLVAGGRAVVFLRRSKHRLDIDLLMVPGLDKAYVERRLDVKLAAVAKARFPEVFLREARFLLSKRDLGAWVGV